MTARKIDYLPLDEVTAANVNPKRHDDDGITASLMRFGYVEPITVDERTGRLVAGHGRVSNLRQLRESGAPAPDGVLVQDGEWLVPVVRGWASKNDREADGYLIASNRLVEAGGWDERELRALLGELVTSDWGDFTSVGFGERDIEAMLSTGPVDVQAEWTGMPEFEQETRMSAFKTMVHFASEDDAKKFFDFLGVRKLASFWWPESDGLVGSSRKLEYVHDDSDEGPAAVPDLHPEQEPR